MTVRLADSIRNARVDAVRDKIDAGPGPGTVKIYTGSQPASVATAPSGTLLVTLTLNDPSFPNAAGGTTTLDNDPVIDEPAVATGTPGWARFADSTGAAVMDVTVGTSGADLTINSASITTAQTVAIDDTNPLTLTDPA